MNPNIVKTSRRLNYELANDLRIGALTEQNTLYNLRGLVVPKTKTQWEDMSYAIVLNNRTSAN